MHLILLTRFHSQHQGPAGTPLGLRLMETALKLGHTLTIINPLEVSLAFGGQESGAFPVMWRGQPFPAADLILPIARWDDAVTWQIAETLHSWGRPITMHQRVPLGDHVSMARLLARRNIPAPRSWVLSHPAQLDMILTDVAFPLLMRSRYGGKGRKVAIVQHSGEAMSHARNLASSGQPFLVQDLPTPLGEDIRLLVVGNEVISTLHRTAPAGFVRPKESENPQVVSTTATSEEIRIALAGAQLYGAPFCAVNILRTEKGPLMLEISRVPTLAEFENTTGADFATPIVNHLAALAERNQQLKAANPQGNVTQFKSA